MSAALKGGKARRLLARMAADCSPPQCPHSISPRAAAAAWCRTRQAHCSARLLPTHFNHRRFATSSSSSSSSTSSSPSKAAGTPNPHLSAGELSVEQLDTIFRHEQQRRQNITKAQQQLTQLKQQLHEETQHDTTLHTRTRLQRITHALTTQQRGVKLLAVLLAIASLTSSMQLVIARDKAQQATSAVRQRLDDRKEAVTSEEAAVEGLVRRLTDYLSVRIAEQAEKEKTAAGEGRGGAEREWLEALRARVLELEAASVCGVDEMRARQAVQSLERDVNARYEASKRKTWW